jgi:GH25 family lysozyme M1 (1,4-beta-N-acetylmuramidase)
MAITLKVLDISHHNTGPNGGPIDFDRIYSFGIRGIIHKSTQGTGMVDNMYASRKQAALRANLLWGAYHFADSSDPEEQVQHFLDVVAPEQTTLVALDFEPNGSNTMTLDGCRKFLHSVEDSLGRKAVLYSGNLIKETLGDDKDKYLSAHRLWIAQYGPVAKVPPAWDDYWLWQFSDGNVNTHGIKVPGISGQVDMNSYEDSDEALTEDWPS